MSTVLRRKTIATSIAFAGVALFVTLVLTLTGPAKPRPSPQSPTAVATAWAVTRLGTYSTAINIHNPSLGTGSVTLEKRAVIALPETSEAATPPAFQTKTLPAGSAMEVDCSDILTLLGSDFTSFPLGTEFIKGYVTIVAPTPLDVVGVYTAEPPQVTGNANYPSVIPGIALEMLNITPRIETLGGTTSPAQTVIEYSAKFLCGTVAPPG